MIFIQFFGLLSGLAFIYMAYRFFESYFKNSPKVFTDASRAGRRGAIGYILSNLLASIILATQAGLAGLYVSPGIFMLVSVIVLVASFFGNKNGNDPVANRLSDLVKKSKSKYDQHRTDNDSQGFRFNRNNRSDQPDPSDTPNVKTTYTTLDEDFYGNLGKEDKGNEPDDK